MIDALVCNDPQLSTLPALQKDTSRDALLAEGDSLQRLNPQIQYIVDQENLKRNKLASTKGIKHLENELEKQLRNKQLERQ